MPDTLDLVHAEQRAAGEPVRPGALAAAVRRTAHDLATKGLSMPDDHAAWLRRSDGLDWDGLLLYGCEPGPDVPSLVEANTLWREGGVIDGLVIGEDDVDVLTVDAEGAARRDRVTMDVAERFASTGEMITDAVARRRQDHPASVGG